MFKYLVKPSGRLRTTLSGKHRPDTQEALGSLQYLKINTKQIKSPAKSCHTTFFRTCSLNEQLNSVSVLEGEVTAQAEPGHQPQALTDYWKGANGRRHLLREGRSLKQTTWTRETALNLLNRLESVETNLQTRKPSRLSLESGQVEHCMPPLARQTQHSI